MLIGSIALFLAAILFVEFLLLPSLAMAQQQQTTTSPPPSSLSTTTTTPPLTPQEQEQQNRLQNVIAATTANLNETQKQIGGVVFTPRWSEPVWINTNNSIAVLLAYCLPGEFADSGQEILGGFELEVLESYAVALPQGFMAWMAVVGNEDDVQNRLPAAVGVICVSDLNQPETRVLSPQEQQEINNINQQFSTIQNTQITNIDQVINIINNVTEPTTTEEQPLRAEAFVNPTVGSTEDIFTFDSNVTGGTPPYNYTWSFPDGYAFHFSKGFTDRFSNPGTYTYILTVADSKGQTASDSVQFTVTEQPLTVEIIPNATSGFTLDRFELKTNVRSGTPPYTYSWNFVGDFQNFAVACSSLDDPIAEPDPSCMVFDTDQAGTHEVIAYVTDSTGKTASDSVQIDIRERPPTNDTGGTPTGQPFRVKIIASATHAYTPASITFEANVTGGTPPYTYNWDLFGAAENHNRMFTVGLNAAGTYRFNLHATDSEGQTASDLVVITVEEPPPPEGGGVLLPPETGEEGAPPGGGLLPGTTPGEDEGEEEQLLTPPPAVQGEEEPTAGGEDTGGAPPASTTEEGGEEEPS